LPEIVPFLYAWKRTAKNLRIFQISLGFLATFFSILTTTLIDVNGLEFTSKITAFIAAVSIGLITAFDLSRKSNNMTDAWRNLVAPVLKFNRGLSQREVVIDAWVQAEKTIGDVTYQQTGGKSGVQEGGGSAGGGGFGGGGIGPAIGGEAQGSDGSSGSVKVGPNGVTQTATGANG
jgi:hypothetical protein